MALLEVKQLSVTFPGESGNNSEGKGFKAVKNISFSIEAGEIVGLVGESGSGKSISSLSVLDLVAKNTGQRSQGSILLDGQDVFRLSEKEKSSLRGRKASMIFQDPMSSLNPVLQCGSQVAEVAQLHEGLSKKSAMDLALQLFIDVGIPDAKQRLKEYPHQLSGGMRQRVMIAMALACKPKLLIADEPTSALDVTVQAQILDLLQSLQTRYKMAILFITHDLALIRQFASKVFVMHNGEIVESGPVELVLDKPTHPYTQALLQSAKALSALSISADSISIEPLDSTATLGKENFTTILEVKNLKVWFPVQRGLFRRPAAWLKAVDGINLNLHQGEVLGIVGESGCGKSTLGRAMLALLEPSDGSVTVAGLGTIDALDREGKTRLRRKAQMIFQDPFASLNSRHSIGQILMEPMAIHSLYPKKERREQAFQLLKKVGLEAQHFNRFPHEFSGGQRQRIAIARALSLKPEILIADEAVSALDVTIQAQILKLLKSIQSEMNLAMVFISHDLGVIAQISHRVAVMYLGRIVEYGDCKQIFENPSHPYTQALLAAKPDITAKLGSARIRLSGDVPSPINPPSGCYFHPRCPIAQTICHTEYPPLEGSPQQESACFFKAKALQRFKESQSEKH